jgi:hypothetical protein
LTQKRKQASKQTNIQINKQTSEKEHLYLKIWDEIRIVKTDPKQKKFVEIPKITEGYLEEEEEEEEEEE